MTYAQNTPFADDPQRTFSRGRVRGSVSAEYEPTEIVYHPSFFKQYRKHLGLYIVLMVLACSSVVFIPVMLVALPLPLFWYRSHARLRDLMDDVAAEAPLIEDTLDVLG